MYEARYTSGKVRKHFGLHGLPGSPGPKSGSNLGTEGATLFVTKPPSVRRNCRAQPFSGLPKYHIGQENKRTRTRGSGS